MLFKQKYLLSIICLLYSFQLFCQSNIEDTFQLVFYKKAPDFKKQFGEKQVSQPYKYINLEILELIPKSITDLCITFSDKSNGNEIVICKSNFLVDQHTYDFKECLIDGKMVFGHDGFYTIDYVRNNFHNELNEICIVNDTLEPTVNIMKTDFPVFIHPYLLRSNGECEVKLFKFKKYFQYLIYYSGGDGAGSYEVYILIDIYNRGWILSKDIYTETFSFVPISKRKDPFSKDGERIWYKIFFK